jgi:predicted nucleotidyltransferase
VDDTAWEIGHFLRLAAHCNPSILEVFAAPVEAATDDGQRLRDLFPAIWHPKGVRDAFIGYGLNQRKKLLDGKDARPQKYAVAYLRTLLQAERLLVHGVLPVDFTRHPEFLALRLFKTASVSIGQVVDKCLKVQESVEDAAEHCTHRPDLDRVNEFLLDVRKRCW